MMAIMVMSISFLWYICSIFVYIYLHVYLYIHTYVYTFLFIYVYKWLSACVCVCVYIYRHTFYTFLFFLFPLILGLPCNRRCAGSGKLSILTFKSQDIKGGYIQLEVKGNIINPKMSESASGESLFPFVWRRAVLLTESMISHCLYLTAKYRKKERCTKLIRVALFWILLSSTWLH